MSIFTILVFCITMFFFANRAKKIFKSKNAKKKINLISGSIIIIIGTILIAKV